MSEYVFNEVLIPDLENIIIEYITNSDYTVLSKMDPIKYSITGRENLLYKKYDFEIDQKIKSSYSQFKILDDNGSKGDILRNVVLEHLNMIKKYINIIGQILFDLQIIKFESDLHINATIFDPCMKIDIQLLQNIKVNNEIRKGILWVYHDKIFIEIDQMHYYFELTPLWKLIHKLFHQLVN